VPPSSVKAFTQYTITLLSARTAYWEATTRISLEKATNESGIEYAKIVFRLGRRLQPEETTALRRYQERMKEALANTAYRVEDEPRPPAHQFRTPSPGSPDQEVPF
jgi:hypothetical protein